MRVAQKIDSINHRINHQPQPELPFDGPTLRASVKTRKRNTAVAQVTAEARQAAFESISGKRSKRHRLILRVLADYGPQTAREVLRRLISQGHLPPTAERNQVSPRLSELADAGTVEALEELRQIGDDPPASAWAITERGRLLLEESRKEGRK